MKIVRLNETKNVPKSILSGNEMNEIHDVIDVDFTICNGAPLILTLTCSDANDKKKYITIQAMDVDCIY